MTKKEKEEEKKKVRSVSKELLTLCSFEGANPAKVKIESSRGERRNPKKFLVGITRRKHPFPFRTRKLSSLVPMILGW